MDLLALFVKEIGLLSLAARLAVDAAVVLNVTVKMSQCFNCVGDR